MQAFINGSDHGLWLEETASNRARQGKTGPLRFTDGELIVVTVLHSGIPIPFQGATSRKGKENTTVTLYELEWLIRG